jgi:protein-disulfide isomerase
VLVGLATLFVGALAWQGMKQAVVSTAGGDGELEIGVYTPSGLLELSGSEAVLGKADAPYLIVEFADFQCPYCARAGAEVKEIVRANPDMQLRFKHYPISSRCNPEVAHEGHKTACDAAFASECARQQGRFWEYTDLLMKNQSYQSPDDLRFIAGQVGLDMGAFQACLATGAPARVVARDAEAAARVEVHGTPTFFVKGLYGDAFVLVRGKPEAILRLVEAHRKGRPMPEPGTVPPDAEE